MRPTDASGSARIPGRGAGERGRKYRNVTTAPPRARRHQRLPASARRDPVVRLQRRVRPACRRSRRLRLDVPGRARVRRQPAVSRLPGPADHAAAHPGGARPGTAGGAKSVRPRSGSVPPHRSACWRRPCARPAQRLVTTTHGHEVGWAALPAAPVRRCAGSGAAWTSSPTWATTPALGWPPSSVPESSSPASPQEWTPTSSTTPASCARPQPGCVSGTDSVPLRWSSACPGWCAAKGRTA